MSVLARDGVWTWYNTPVVTYHDGKAYFGAWPSDWARPMVGAFDTVGRADVTYGFLTSADVYQIDDHNNPAITRLASGKILACFSEHQGESNAVTSVNADDIRTWNAPVQTYSGAEDSYAQVCQAEYDETIYWFFRRTASSGRQQFYRTSTDDGATWSSDVQLFRKTGKRPYFRWWRTSGTRFDFCVTDSAPNEDVNSLYHGYMTVDASTGARAYYKSDATLIGDDTTLPLEITDLTQVYDGTSDECWNWDIKVVNGQPTIGFVRFPSHGTTAHEYYRARFNGSTWDVEKICDGGTTADSDSLDDGTGSGYYSGGISIDPLDEDIAYVSREYSDDDFRLEQWTKSGSWSKTVDISGDTGNKNARPVAVDCGGTTNVFYWRGLYPSYTDFTTDIAVWPDASFRTEKAVSSNPDATLTPFGSKLYLPLTEGSGTPANLLAGYTPSTTGTVTWSTTSGFGYYLSGFSTSNYVTFDSLASDFAAATGTRWCAVMFENTSTTASQYLFSLGRSSTDTPFWGISLNNGGTTGLLAYNIRNNASSTTSVTATSQPLNDGNRHVVMGLHFSGGSNRMYLFLDGEIVGTPSGSTPGTITLDRATIGCLRRSSNTNAYNGKIYAVAFGWGYAPHPRALYDDWSNGRFSGLGTDVAGPPTNSVAPAVTGTEATGKTLSCTTGTWTGADSYAYQWYSNTAASEPGATPISGATSSTYVIDDSLDDLHAACLVTATNEEGSTSEFSNFTGQILGLNVVVKANPTFADVADFDQQTLFNEAIGDDGTGEEMPAPTTWNTDSPVGDIDWSAFTLAVDANAINRSNRAGATLISPNYVVLAQHAPGDNTGHTWMTPAGAEVTRTLGETLDVDYWEFSGSDLALAKLSAPINNITPMPMILDSSKIAGRGCLVLEMDRHLNAYVVPEDLTNADISVNVYQDPGTDYIESGDSGKPVTIIINDTAVMVMTAMFASSIDGSRYIGLGPNASYFIDELFAIMAEDGESPTVWDLRSGDDGAVSGNPGSSPTGQVTSSPTNMPIALLRKYHANAR